MHTCVDLSSSRCRSVICCFSVIYHLLLLQWDNEMGLLRLYIITHIYRASCSLIHVYTASHDSDSPARLLVNPTHTLCLNLITPAPPRT